MGRVLPEGEDMLCKREVGGERDQGTLSYIFSVSRDSGSLERGIMGINFVAETELMQSIFDSTCQINDP